MPSNDLEQFFKKMATVTAFHRKKSGLNRAQLAKLAGVGKTSVFDVEHGKATVRLDTLVKILHVLNITLEFTGPLMNSYQVSYANS